MCRNLGWKPIPNSPKADPSLSLATTARAFAPGFLQRMANGGFEPEADAGLGIEFRDLIPWPRPLLRLCDHIAQEFTGLETCVPAIGTKENYVHQVITKPI